jgi:replication-associated recombination protein RarA
MSELYSEENAYEVAQTYKCLYHFSYEELTQVAKRAALDSPVILVEKKQVVAGAMLLANAIVHGDENTQVTVMEISKLSHEEREGLLTEYFRQILTHTPEYQQSVRSELSDARFETHLFLLKDFASGRRLWRSDGLADLRSV